MRKAGRRDFAGGDHDPRAHPGPVPHLHGKDHGHADAAVRSRIAREHAGMYGDARPCDPLHVRHRGAAIDIGAVEFVFLNDAENAHRRRMATHARGDRCFREESVGVVNLQALLVDRDRDDQRPLRLGRFLRRRLDPFCLRPAHPWPLRNGRRRQIIVAGIVTRPIIDGSVGLRGGADRAGQRQKGNSPKPSGVNRSPMPTHAYHLRILSHCYLLLQTRYAFTSVTVPIP